MSNTHCRVAELFTAGFHAIPHMNFSGGLYNPYPAHTQKSAASVGFGTMPESPVKDGSNQVDIDSPSRETLIARDWSRPPAYDYFGIPHEKPPLWYPFCAMNRSVSADQASAKRKNATRESTATLKSWLREHAANPYPTKGEKIMLAIISKMTLTQVSTWFANARRRLKKENKMTWHSKDGAGDGREEEDDEDADIGDHIASENSDSTDSIDPSAGAFKEAANTEFSSSPSSRVTQIDSPKIWSIAAYGSQIRTTSDCHSDPIT